MLQQVTASGEELYNLWKQEPTESNLAAVVSAFKNDIDYQLSNYGANTDPAIRTQAKLAVVRAIRNFNPQRGASLRTHVANSMKSLNRTIRQLRQPIRVPERDALHLAAINKAKEEFLDKKGHEPSYGELADWTGIPIKTIQKIQRSNRPVVSENQLGEEGVMDTMGQTSPDYLEEAVSYVYSAAPPKHQKIWEDLTGWGGNQPKKIENVAQTVNLSPSQVSRIFAAMTNELMETKTALEEIQRP